MRSSSQATLAALSPKRPAHPSSGNMHEHPGQRRRHVGPSLAAPSARRPRCARRPAGRLASRSRDRTPAKKSSGRSRMRAPAEEPEMWGRRRRRRPSGVSSSRHRARRCCGAPCSSIVGPGGLARSSGCALCGRPKPAAHGVHAGSSMQTTAPSTCHETRMSGGWRSGGR